MGTGTSFDGRDHFDNLFVYTSACSNNVRDSMQSSMRVRHIAKERLFYTSHTRYIGDKCRQVYDRVVLRDVIDGRVSYLAGREDVMFGARTDLPEWQRELWATIRQEDNVSAFLHGELLKAYLEECGYLLEEGEADAASEGIELTDTSAAIDFFEIATIARCEYDQIGRNLMGGRASEEDKAKHLKYSFTYMLRGSEREATDEELRGMFRVFVKNREGVVVRVRNVGAERSRCVTELTSVFQYNQMERCAAVGALCETLGLESSFAVGQEVPRARVMAAVGTILERADQLKDVFDLRLRIAADSGCKQAIALVNQCFRKWGFTELKCAPRSKKRKEGGWEEQAGYVVEEQVAFKGYGSRAPVMRCPA